MKRQSMLLVLLTTAAMLIYPSTFTSAAPVSVPGGPEAWEEQWNVPLPAGATPNDVLKSISDIWAAEKNWTSLKEDRVDSSGTTVWSFTDQTGKRWIATASAQSSPTKSGYAFVTLRIASASPLSDPRSAKRTCEL